MSNSLLHPTCSMCERQVEAVSEKGLCKQCIDKILIPMRCLECRDQWESHGLDVWCPSCGSMNVTSNDKVLDSWRWKEEAAKNGLEFIGIQKGIGPFPNSPMFHDPETKTTFVIQKGETLAQALDRKRKQFILSVPA